MTVEDNLRKIRDFYNLPYGEFRLKWGEAILPKHIANGRQKNPSIFAYQGRTTNFNRRAIGVG